MTTDSSPCEYAQGNRGKRQRKSPSQSVSPSTKVECRYQYKIVDIVTWLCGFDEEEDLHETKKGTNDIRRSVLPLVDLRSVDEYNERRIDTVHDGTLHEGDEVDNDNNNSSGGGIIIVHLPLSTLLSGERSCELPPRNLDFAILIPREHAETFLDQYHGGSSCGGDDGGEKQCTIHKLFFATHSEATMQSRKPWRVRQVLIDSDALWKEAENIKDLVVARRGGTSGGGDFGAEGRRETPFRCLPRLWKPDPLISLFVLPYLKKWTIDFDSRSNDLHGNNSSLRPTTMGLVWDLGCGSGRDICYVAEEIKEFRDRCNNNSSRALHFIGVDNHKGSAARCTPLWKNRDVEDVTSSICLDLNKLHLVRDFLMDPTKELLQLPPRTADCPPDIVCIYSIRFLNRKLLSYIANSRTIDESVETLVSGTCQSTTNRTYSSPQLSHLVLPLGAVIAISHFCKHHEGASWNFDHPKESNVLDRWELKNLFDGASSADLESRHDCGTQRWQILKDDLIVDGDHGRTLIQFAAKKIA
ncbi:hypothetical protein ACHAWU_003017 [Discostella pseudostelligera]|uniref:Uncharacterized protein n=1 Tax=Discostella pseudostelligera TaxID=259834 RepID=A0ABD3MAG6_9STRA